MFNICGFQEVQVEISKEEISGYAMEWCLEVHRLSLTDMMLSYLLCSGNYWEGSWAFPAKFIRFPVFLSFLHLSPLFSYLLHVDFWNAMKYRRLSIVRLFHSSELCWFSASLTVFYPLAALRSFFLKSCKLWCAILWYCGTCSADQS